jgi:hypothetical protein
MARQQERDLTGQRDLAGRGARVEKSGAGEKTRYVINGTRSLARSAGLEPATF